MGAPVAATASKDLQPGEASPKKVSFDPLCVPDKTYVQSEVRGFFIPRSSPWGAATVIQSMVRSYFIRRSSPIGAMLTSELFDDVPTLETSDVEKEVLFLANFLQLEEVQKNIADFGWKTLPNICQWHMDLYILILKLICVTYNHAYSDRYRISTQYGWMCVRSSIRQRYFLQIANKMWSDFFGMDALVQAEDVAVSVRDSVPDQQCISWWNRYDYDFDTVTCRFYKTKDLPCVTAEIPNFDLLNELDDDEPYPAGS